MNTTPPFRVALFHPALVHGGIQRVFLNLADGLNDQGLAVDLVQASPSDGLRDQVPAGVQLIDLNARRALTSFMPLLRYLHRARPDAIISGAIQTNLVATWAKRLTGLPATLILTEHNMISLVTKHARTLRGRLTPVLIRMFYRWADEVIAVSHGSAKDLALTMNVPPERVHVVYNPIIGADFWKRASEPLTDEIVLSDRRPMVLAVGRLEFEKDYTTLLHAFSQLKRQVDARLVILGDGEDRVMLQTLTDSLGLRASVYFLGNVTNPLPYMKAARVLALSSMFETLPTVLIEALAMGLPIVCTDAPTGPSEILCDGAYGTLVPVGDVPALATALRRVMQEGNGRTSHEKALERFRCETAIQSYLQILGLGALSPSHESHPDADSCTG